MTDSIAAQVAAQDRRLVVIERDAALVRRIFDRFAKTGSALIVARELNAAGEGTKQRLCANGARGGNPWTNGAVYKVLANRVYLGEAVHKGVGYSGEHAAIPEREVTVLLADFATVWRELFPVEQARIVQSLVERVDLQEDALEVRIRAEGLVSLVGELRQQGERMAA
jgi:Recombinase